MKEGMIPGISPVDALATDICFAFEDGSKMPGTERVKQKKMINDGAGFEYMANATSVRMEKVYPLRQSSME